MRNRRRIIYFILILAIAASGCGKKMPADEGREIELLDPVDAPAGWEMAAYRTLYNTSLYPATVFPRTEEYSFEKNVVLDRFCVRLGESVEKGEVLAYANDASLERSIWQKEEQIRQMEEEFQEYKKEAEEALAKQEEIYHGLYHGQEGDGHMLAHGIETARTQLEQRTCLYELDHDHALKQLERMKEELKQGILISSIDGSVVAMIDRESGNYISEKDNVIAIGDMGQKLLKCKYINKATAAKAKDIYALVDGRRYEVIYQPMDSEEYARRSAQNETIYTTFELAEPAEDIAVGDFAVIVVVNDIRENVLSIPQSAIHKDAAGTFVYLKQGEESVAADVVTGMSDGAYTEILDGMEGGDWVLAEEAITPGEKRAVVEKGSFHSNFAGSGYLEYSSSSKVRNPITYGTVYFVEYKKSFYEHVEEGDVIAIIRVQQDEVALKRNQVKLARLQERLAALESGEDEVSEKTLAAKREEIEEVQNLIRAMEADYATTEIRAEQSGLIINMRQYRAEDILGTGAEFVEIADESTCYVKLEDSKQQLSYGSKVTVSYTNKEGGAGTTNGMVATLSAGGAEGSLRAEDVLILLPPEAVKEIEAVRQDRNGYFIRNSFKVEASIREMDDVLLIPKGAVWETNGQAYVFVVEADGSVVARSFIAGGNDASHYWVVDGLTEGMEICIK